MSASYAAIQKKFFVSEMTTFSNEDLNDIIKIIKSLEDSSLSIKSAAETVKNEVKEQKGGFLGTLAATLGASLLGNMLAGKGVIRFGEGTIREDEGSLRAGQNF